MVDGSPRLRLVGQQTIAIIQEQNAEMLDFLMRENRLQIFHQPFPIA